MNIEKRTTVIVSIGLVVVICLSIVLYYLLVTMPNNKEMARHKALVEQYYNEKIDCFENENKTLNNVQVAFIGDSLTDRYDLDRYYPQYTTINRGISGDTTFGLEKRLKVSLYDANPEVVVMLIGGNNIYTMFDNYESILQKLKDNMPTSKIVLLSLTAMSKDCAEKNEQAIINNQKIKSLANKYDYAFVDLFTPLYNIKTGEMYVEYSDDGAHLTQQGYEVVTNTITPVLATLLG